MSDIIRVEFEDLLNYITCPVKVTLQKQENDYNVISNIYLATCQYYFSKLFLNFNINYYRLSKAFNRFWGLSKHKFTKSIKLNTLTGLKTPLEEIISLVKEDEDVIAFDYPIFLEIDNYFITDTLSAIVYNNKTKYIKLIKIQDNTDYITEDLRNLYMYSYLFLISKGLPFPKNKITIEIYNPYLMFYYKEDDVNRSKEYKEMLLNVCKAYVSRLIYPLPGKTKCANCLHKSSCKWKYTLNNITHKINYK